MKKKNLRDWVREHREDIDATIVRVCGRQLYKNDDERRGWVLNDQGLYLWAKSEGVEI